MKYLLTIINDESQPGPADPTPEQMAEMIEPWNRFNHELLDAGAFVSGEPLHPSASATTVRFSEGDQTVTDGPFAETHEWIAGFDILDCADLDEAIELASRHPMATSGIIDIRPAWPLDLD